MPKSRFIDILAVYEIIKRLSTPFVQTQAYKAGLIDKNGKSVKPRKDMTPKERVTYSLFDVMIFNIKRLLARLPGGDSKLRNFATGLLLLKEDIESGEIDFEMVLDLVESIQEDAPISMSEFLYEDEGGGGDGASADSTNTTDNVQNYDPILGSKKKKKKELKENETYGNCVVFEVGSDVFDRCMAPKAPSDRYKKFVGEGPKCDAIREYAKANPGKSIIIKCETTQAYTFLRLGSKSRF